MGKDTRFSKYSLLAVVPAREGSKSIKFKNIQNFRNQPLFVWSLEFANAANCFSRVLLSTESKTFADVARENKHTVPFLRSTENATDTSRDYQYLQEIWDQLRRYPYEEEFDATVLLRPTYPIRELSSFRESLYDFLSEDLFCSLKSIIVSEQTPFKMWTLRENKELIRIVGTYGDDMHNYPRQELPVVYWQDGNFDIYKKCSFMEICDKHRYRLKGVVSPKFMKDLDSVNDFHEALNSTQNSARFFIREIQSLDPKVYSS